MARAMVAGRTHAKKNVFFPRPAFVVQSTMTTIHLHHPCPPPAHARLGTRPRERCAADAEKVGSSVEASGAIPMPLPGALWREATST